MKSVKIIIAYLSILCFFINGLIIFQEIFEYNRGDEGYGILISVIWDSMLNVTFVLGGLILVTDLITKNKSLPKLPWVLLSYSTISYLISKVYNFLDPENWILLITCIISIFILILEIAQNNK